MNPRIRAARVVLAAALLAAPLGAADAASAAEYVPFVTDFPKPAEKYVPFVTDFPKPVYAPAAPEPSGDGTDWAQLGVQGGSAALLAGLLAGAVLAVARRTETRRAA